jgi:hypothetical protein
MDDFVCFGDSHSFCFDKIMKTHYFPASSARGLNNNNSLTGTNKTIKTISEGSKYKKHIFFFGKVDIDFILNHMINKHDDFDIPAYINTTVSGYINFIKTLNTTNIYVCELPVGHLSDSDLLDVLNSEFNHNCVAAHLKEKYEKLKVYVKVLPLDERNRHLIHFNKILKELCIKNNYIFLEINKYFTHDTCGKITVPKKYLNTDIHNHHLDDSIYELYMKGI